MMKKLSKIALLAAASAFMLAVFPACGDSEEDDPPKATLAGDAVELKTGEDVSVEATVTLENDTFSAEAKTIAAEHEIPTKYFELKAGTGVTVSAATLKTWDSDTKATITFTVTAAEGAAEGTISAEIKEGTLSSNKALTATGTIDYTIKSAEEDLGEGGDEGDDGEDAESHGTLTYNFDDITITSDKAGATSVLDGKVVVHQTATNKIKITDNTGGNHHYIQASCGGSSAMAPSHANTTGYLAVKAAKAGKEKITFTFTTVKSTKGVSNNQIAIYGATDGTAPIKTSEVIECPTTDDNTERTLTIEATVPETFYVTFIRSAGSGGFKFSKIEQEY